jgi:hypothetical protein
LLSDFLWENEKSDYEPELVLLYLIVVKTLLQRIVLVPGTDLERKAYRATALILYRMVRQSGLGKDCRVVKIDIGNGTFLSENHAELHIF